MSLAKRLLRSDTGQRFIVRLVELYIRFVDATTRWTVEGGDIPPRLHGEGKPFFVAFWHGRLLMMPAAWRRNGPLRILISAHRDGRIIAEAIKRFGIDSIAGSSTDGGWGAAIEMVRAIKGGHSIGITPDGPDGPAMRVGQGTATVARLAQVPVLPVTYATGRRIILGSWDRFHLPLPFSRGLFICAEPVPPPDRRSDEAALERWRLALEQQMMAQTADADRRLGNAVLSPGTVGRKAARAARHAAREPG